ncbi:unnamed protein product, partial [Pylaiella littoralis]
LFINFVLFGAGLPMQGSTRTPDRTASAGNQRRHTTPSLSTQAWACHRDNVASIRPLGQLFLLLFDLARNGKPRHRR